MKTVSKISVLFLVACLVIGNTTNVLAQNPMTTDVQGTVSHVKDSIQEKINKFQEKMKVIAQSKFIKTIGKGIEKAKKAIKYATEKINAAKKFINDKKKAILESKAYKAAMVAKQVAEEAKKLKALEDKRESEIAAAKEENTLEKDTLEAKLKAAEENYDNGLQIFEEELANASEVEKKSVEEKINTYKTSSESEKEEIKKQLSALDVVFKKREKDINVKFAEEIIAEKDKIMELTNEAKTLSESSGKKNKKEERTTQEEADELVDKFVDKKPLSLSAIAQNKKRRMKEARKKLSETINKAIAKVDKTEGIKEDQENQTESSATMDGTSESIHVATQNLAAQLDILYGIIEGDLKKLQSETTSQLATMNMMTNLDASTMIDMCNYSKEGCPAGAGLGGLKNMVEKTVKSVQEKAAEVKGAVNQAKEFAQEATEAVNQAKDTVKGAANTVSDIKNSVSEDLSLKGMGI